METKGLFILAVRDVLMNPQLVLGENVEKFLDIKPDEWYPGQLQIELTDIIEKKLGRLNLLRLGRNIVQKRKESIREDGFKSPLGYFKEIYTRYLDDNRGAGIGRIEVLEALEGYVRIKNSTPYNCIMTEGIYEEIINVLGCSLANVNQTMCKKKGHPYCEFEIIWRQ